jgi:hypothetical protein
MPLYVGKRKYLKSIDELTKKKKKGNNSIQVGKLRTSTKRK